MFAHNLFGCACVCVHTKDRTGLVSYDEFCEFLFPDIAASMEEAMEMEMMQMQQEKMMMQRQGWVTAGREGGGEGPLIHL